MYTCKIKEESICRNGSIDLDIFKINESASRCKIYCAYGK